MNGVSTLRGRIASTVKKGAELRQYMTFTNITLGIFILCCALIGPFEQFTSFFSLALLLILLVNWNKDEFYIYIVIFMLFTEQFYLIGGSTPLYRVYSYLLLIKFLLEIGKAKFRPQFLPAIVVFVLFCALAVGRMSLRIGANLIADALLGYMVLIRVREKPNLMRRMMLVYTLVAVCCGIYSFTADALVRYETGLGAQVEMVRYYGTVGDANYAGFFYNIAIFMTLCSDYTKKWYIRGPLLVALFYFLFLTSSMTGLLCCAICGCIYIALRYRAAGIPAIVIFLVCALGFAYLLLYVPAVQNFGPLATISKRLVNAVLDFEMGNVRGLTTNRTTLWKTAIDFFQREPLLQKLIGGNVITSVISEEYWLRAVGAVHQTYVQGLLDFGIIGAVIVFGTRIFQTMSDTLCCLRGWRLPLEIDLLRATVLCSFIFLIYAFTIDMFMDWRFLFFYFM